MTHDVRVRCQSCGTWYWAGDAHTCPPSDFLTAAVMAAAFPTHDRMLTAEADASARRAGEAYHARIEHENTYYAGLFGLIMKGKTT